MAHVKCFKTLNSCRFNLGVTHGEFDVVGNNQNIFNSHGKMANGKKKKKKM
jgi:hypothetical protein